MKTSTRLFTRFSSTVCCLNFNKRYRSALFKFFFITKQQLTAVVNNHLFWLFPKKSFVCIRDDAHYNVFRRKTICTKKNKQTVLWINLFNGSSSKKRRKVKTIFIIIFSKKNKIGSSLQLKICTRKKKSLWKNEIK